MTRRSGSLCSASARRAGLRVVARRLPQSARRAWVKAKRAASVVTDRSHRLFWFLSFIGVGYLAFGLVRGVEGPELRSSLLSGRSCRISTFVAPAGGANTDR